MGNIYLIGMRGVGKSEVGKLLAEKLCRKFLDSDFLIEQQEKISLPELVEKHGWDYFRKVEHEVVQSLVQEEHIVCSFGGGAPVYFAHDLLLKSTGMVIYLSAHPRYLVERLKTSKRPSLTGKPYLEEVEEVLASRKSVYENCAHYSIATDEKTTQDIVDEILDVLA